MSGDQYARLAYLLLLLLAVGGYFLAESRKNMGQTAKQAAVWGLIFVGFIAGFGLWNDIRDDVAPRQSLISAGVVEVPRSDDGHYYLTVHLNEVPVQFVVDTGATDVVLTLKDAERVGLDPTQLRFTELAMTANGEVRTATARIGSVQIGDIRDNDLRVSVTEGELDISLLGMSYLQHFEHIEIQRGKLVLTR
ncbi:MAG: TIGR02281 family clan AA aspartic protease [Paracoccaceae bacterium]|nr:TIGR02281 family clan AA aspartic protease [Paracoccaceae bacterium]